MTLDAAQEADDDGAIFSILQEIEQWVLKSCQSLSQDLRSTSLEQKAKGTLHDYLFPDTTTFQLVTINDQTELRLQETSLSYEPMIQRLSTARRNIPVFRPSEIVVVSQLRPSRVLKVSVNNAVMCCKLAGPYYPDLCRELEVMQHISDVDAHFTYNIPRMRGFVRSEDGPGVIGFLMDYIQTTHKSPDLSSRESIRTLAESRRKKWVSQVEDIVRGLHSIGVCWGDAKMDNLLIDLNDDVWLIDLGGGRTEGWVSKELQDSKKGDLQGVELIRNFLSTDKLHQSTI
ncbi:MAG: hypothetical protein M1817_003895 [Caeruleum heppii]|nr:MAG: hypothetical protein M1817_003895 [Caeruleum heppii]